MSKTLAIKERWTDSQLDALKVYPNNLLVSASAGSGKTSVLVEKIVRFVQEGGDLRRLAVMTFTKAAAQEMKERIAAALYRALRNDPENERLKEQAQFVPFAAINTIDGYCHALVRRYFSELGDDVASELMTEDEAKLLFDKSADEVILAAFTEGDEVFFKLLNKMIANRDVKKLKEIIAELHKFFDAQPDREGFIVTVRQNAQKPFKERDTTCYTVSKLRRRAAFLLQRVCAARRAIGADFADMDANLSLSNALLQELSEAFDIDAVAAVAQASKNRDYPRFDYRAVRKAYLSEYTKIQSLRKASVEFLKDAERYASVAELETKEQEGILFSEMLLDLTVKSELIYKKKKRDSGKQDYADIERLAYRVLSDDLRRAEIAAELDFIYVDEYQDTNYLQEAIVLRLSSGDNVFMVGDPKQAIYQFRLAEPKIFVNKYRRYQRGEGGVKIDLKENFRSDPQVLRFINRIFEPLMTADFGGVAYKEDAALIPGAAEYPKAEGGLPAVEVCLYEDEPQEHAAKLPITQPYSVKNDQSIKEEKENLLAARIAAKIQSILGRPVYNAKKDCFQPITCADIAVLVADNNQTAQIAAVLNKAGIPAAASGKAKDEKNKDIQLLNLLLAVADNRKNEIPLASLMASPIGGFRAQELAEIRTAQPNMPFWESITNYSGNDMIVKKRDALFALLQGIALRSGFLTVKDLLLWAFAQSGYDSFLMSQPDGSARLAAVNAYLNALPTVECSFRLKDYLVDADALNMAVETPASDETVKVMTIHKSKGLEFPVVFVAHTHKRFRADSTRASCLVDKDMGIAVKYFNDDGNTVESTVATDALQLKSDCEGKEERLRLMYVAMTRARNILYFVGKKKADAPILPEDSDCFSAFFAFSAERDPGLETFFAKWSSQPTSAVLNDINLDDVGECPLKEDISYRYPHQGATELGVKYTVSELNADLAEDFVPTYVAGDGGSAETGTLYHKVLEHIDFNARGQEDMLQQLDDLQQRGILTAAERQELDVSTLSQILKNDVLKMAAEGKALREQPFLLYVPANEIGLSAAQDKVLVQGVIDLLIIKDGQIVLVDYKVTALDDASCKMRYGAQINLYALAAEKILGQKIDKKYLFILNRNTVLPVT